MTITQKFKSLDQTSEHLGNVKYLQCINCNEIYSLQRLKEEQGTTLLNVCYANCLGPLSLIFDLEKIKISKNDLFLRKKRFSMIHELLPFENVNIEKDFAFSELRYSTHYSSKLGLNVYFKLDMDLTSGSFKDRPVLAAFKRAKEVGYDKVFVASTGNLAISCLKLGKEFGFDVKVYLSNTINKKRRTDIEQFADNLNKQIITVSGSYDDANVLAIKDCENQNIIDLKENGQYKTFVPNYTFRPYYKEGSKTSGFEIALQLIEKNISPSRNIHIFYPVGSGALLCSAYKGINELQSLGLFKNNVSFYGIQQSSLNPVVEAFRNNNALRPQVARNHLVKEIAIGNPGSGIETLKIIRKSNGWMEDVTDKETIQSFFELNNNENIFPQLCGAMTISGFEKIHSYKKFSSNDVIVINITGNGNGKIEDDLWDYINKYGIGE